MPAATSGLQRDLQIIRRRAWIFIPFLIVGLVVAFAFSAMAGDTNAVASITLDTIVHDAVIGGDRGLRIFEAEAMASDERFKEKVREQASDPNLDFSRFSISLSPISVADGVSRGILTVSIKDADQETAERLRQVWVDTYLQEFTSEDGLFRTRFIEKRREVAEGAERDYQEALARLRGAVPNLPVEAVLAGDGPSTLIAEINRKEADLRAELALLEASVATGPGGPTEELRARRLALTGAVASLAAERSQLSDSSLSTEVLAILNAVRGADQVKRESFTRLANAAVAVRSAESRTEVSYSLSGGFAGSAPGRVAVTLAVTMVLGLVAIYGWEWLGQVRSGSSG